LSDGGSIRPRTTLVHMERDERTRVLSVRVTERMFAEITRRAVENYTTTNAATVALIAAGLRLDREPVTAGGAS
jgi:hypothetical protein